MAGQVEKKPRPRDLAQLRNALRLLPDMKALLHSAGAELLTRLAVNMGDQALTLKRLERAIIEDPPMLIRDGGVIAEGYDEELDELRSLRSSASAISPTGCVPRSTTCAGGAAIWTRRFTRAGW